MRITSSPTPWLGSYFPTKHLGSQSTLIDRTGPGGQLPPRLTVLRRPSPSESLDGSVPQTPWSKHQAFLAENWEIGRSISILAPTGRGKSYLSRQGLLPILNRAEKVLIFEDDAEAKFPGFSIKTKRFPNRAWREYYRARFGEDYQPLYRLVIPEDLTQKSILNERTRVFGAMRQAFRERNWVLVFPEAATMTEPLGDYGLGLRGPMNILWRKARRRKLTVIAETQAPRWVPRAFYDQPWALYMGKIGDQQARIRFREIGGNSKLLEAALPSLGKHEFVFAAEAGDIIERVQVGRG